MSLIPLAAVLGLLVALGLLERRSRDLAWRDVPIRVHVNGTRGKSTVTRLIWSALREAGIPAVAKTTGTEPRLLLPDGRERPVRRLGPASVREQLRLLRMGRRLHARAVVVECMALDPELQWISEHRMIRAAIAVVTNVRPDHVEIMGASAESIAGCLANTIPAGGVVVAGDRATGALLADRARLAGARLVVAVEGERDEGDWLAENRRTALAVTRELGIADEVAARGFDSVPHDPGAVRTGRVLAHDWVDATAANDPVSLERLVPGANGRDPVVAIYNHRGDRGPRLQSFLRHPGTVAQAGLLIITGARPAFTLWREVHRRRPGGTTIFVPPNRLARWVARRETPARLVFCGNTKGIDVSGVVSEVARRG